MEHLENHLHAFLDSNNRVTQILCFDGHDTDLLEQVREHLNADRYVCCCDNGIAYVGGDLFEGKFYPAKPYEEWIRDTEKVGWIAPEGWVNPDIVEE